MQMYVFSLRDAAALEYGRPFYDVSAGSAIRSFTAQVNSPSPQGEFNFLHTNPEDYELYELGFFFTSTGTFDLYPEPKPLIQASKVRVK